LNTTRQQCGTSRLPAPGAPLSTILAHLKALDSFEHLTALRISNDDSSLGALEIRGSSRGKMDIRPKQIDDV
jgi:hypothetical protein